MDCPVCLEQFKPPILMLNCGHNLCGTCANHIMNQSDGQEWSCPICRKTQFKYRELPRNWLAEQSLESLIDMDEYKTYQAAFKNCIIIIKTISYMIHVHSFSANEF